MTKKTDEAMHVSCRQTKSRGQASLREQERGALGSLSAKTGTKVNTVAGQQRRPTGKQLVRFSGFTALSMKLRRGPLLAKAGVCRRLSGQCSPKQPNCVSPHSLTHDIAVPFYSGILMCFCCRIPDCLSLASISKRA